MNDETPRLNVLEQLAPMRRYALSLTRDPSRAEDLVQDALVRALERQEQFRPGRNLRGWLLSILHNRFVDGLRSDRSEAIANADLLREQPGEQGPTQEHALRLADVRRAFLSLPQEQRAALHLVTIEGLSYDEAAAALAIPVGTLVSRISRARARLRDMEDGTLGSNVVPFKSVGGPDAAQS